VKSWPAVKVFVVTPELDERMGLFPPGAMR